MSLIKLFFIVAFSVVLYFNSNTVYSQNKPKKDNLEKLLIKISRQNYLFVNHNLTNKSIKYANKLNGIATDEELLNLLKTKSQIDFSYAFWLLSKRNYNSIDTIYKEFSNDSTNNGLELNKYKNNKSCLKIYYPVFAFVNDIFNKKEYLDVLK